MKDQKGKTLKLNERVVIPRYFWKAICDPSDGISVAVIAENPIYGDNNNNRGKLYYYSLNELKRKYPDLNLPSFAEGKCNPSNNKNFLKYNLV